MFRCNVSLLNCVLVCIVCVLPCAVFAQTDQAPVDRDIPKIQEDQRELPPPADHATEIILEDVTVEKDSFPTFTGDTSLDSLKTNLSGADIPDGEPVLAKKEFLFTNLDMQVTAVTFLMWIVMMCWAAFSS